MKTFEEKSQSEEWGGWKIVSDMLDKPDSIGIYLTSECYEKLHDFVVEQKEKARQETLFLMRGEIEKKRKTIFPLDTKPEMDLKSITHLAEFNKKSMEYNQALDDLLSSLQSKPLTDKE